MSKILCDALIHRLVSLSFFSFVKDKMRLINFVYNYTLNISFLKQNYIQRIEFIKHLKMHAPFGDT